MEIQMKKNQQQMEKTNKRILNGVNIKLNKDF